MPAGQILGEACGAVLLDRCPYCCAVCCLCQDVEAVVSEPHLSLDDGKHACQHTQSQLVQYNCNTASAQERMMRG